jgi:hypothetical protein
VFSDGDGKVTFAWIADLLPDELAAETEQAMELGLAAIKDTLERASVGEPLGAA